MAKLKEKYLNNYDPEDYECGDLPKCNNAEGCQDCERSEDESEDNEL